MVDLRYLARAGLGDTTGTCIMITSRVQRVLAVMDTQGVAPEVRAVALRELTRMLGVAADGWAGYVIVAAVLKPIRELHYPADNDAARTPRCPECLGKAGVHPCGCWADEDQQPVCGHCYWLRSVREPWPCPTVRLLDQIEADCKGGE